MLAIKSKKQYLNLQMFIIKNNFVKIFNRKILKKIYLKKNQQKCYDHIYT